MKERWKGPDANCTLHHVFPLHTSIVWGCFLLAFAFASSGYFLRTDAWRWQRDLSKMWSFLFRCWEYPGKIFSQNEDFGLCVVFIYICYFSSLLLWIIESWLNMSSKQLNITFWGKFILCTPLLFYCEEKRKKKKKTETQRAVPIIGHSSQCLPSKTSDNTGKAIQWSKAVMRFFSSINRHDLAKWKKMV